MDKTSKWLVITEKPSVAGDLAKALGGFEKHSHHYESSQFYITWAVGHLLEFLEPEELDPKYKRWLLQDLPILPSQFQYKPKKGQTERLAHIKNLARKTHVLGFINACDAGREGELIFREIYDYCLQEKPFQRLWLQSLTPESIRTEFQFLKPGTDFDHLADAARCRSESDWLIGMNATRAVTKRLKTRNTKGVWSVGRVQTPTLALIVKRELEHLKHRPEPYFTLEARFSTPTHEYFALWFDPFFKKSIGEDSENGGTFLREKEDRIFVESHKNLILKDFEACREHASATEIRKESREIAPQLFDLTLLQREANRKLGMSAARTLQAAQRLYEKHKLLTYPRTDSRYLPEDYQAHVKKVIEEYSKNSLKFSKACQKILQTGLLNKERVFQNKFVSDHFAIIPTTGHDGRSALENLEGDDARIFELVLKRFFAAFLPYAVWAKVERVTKVGAQHFKTKVQDLQVPGWREVYGLDTEEESRLPELNERRPEAETAVTAEDITIHENATKPPARYSEAKLLSLMEHCGRSVSDEELALVLKDKGIGTPATRSEIIENLIAKEYVTRNSAGGKTLKATSKGIRLVDVLSRIPVDALSKVELTGEIEADLRKMEKGQKKRSKFMQEMFEFTSSLVEKARNFDYDTIYQMESPLGSCPACHKGQILEGFWGYKCSFAPSSKKNSNSAAECSFIIWKEKNQRYIDRSVVVELLIKKVAGPFEFYHPQGHGAYEEYLTISLQKGIVFCNELGEPKEKTAAQEAVVLHEERVQETFLKLPGVIKVTENAFLCTFGHEEALETTSSSVSENENVSLLSPKKRGRKKTPVVPSQSNGQELSPTNTLTPQKPPRAKKMKRVMSRMPKILCGREMTLEDYKSFILTGATPPIADFKSKKGRAFAAELKLKSNGSFEFKFVSRKNLLGEDAAQKAPRKRTRKKAKVIKKT